MRLRNVEVTNSLTISDAIVLCSKENAEFLVADLFGTGCTFLSSADQLAATGLGRRRLVLVERRGEVIVEALGRFGKDPSRYASLGLLVPECESTFLDHVAGHPAGDGWAVRRLAVTSGFQYVEMVAASSDDVQDAAPIFSALALGLGQRRVAPPDAPNDSIRAMLTNYQSMLQFIDEADLTSHPAHLRTPAEAADSLESRVTDVELAAVQKSLVQTRTALDALQRKYDALAGSKLGGLTLRYWNRSRKGSRG